MKNIKNAVLLNEQTIKREAGQPLDEDIKLHSFPFYHSGKTPWLAINLKFEDLTILCTKHKVYVSLLEGQELTAKWEKLKNTNISDNESYKKGYIFMIYMVIFFSKYKDNKKWM